MTANQLKKRDDVDMIGKILKVAKLSLNAAVLSVALVGSVAYFTGMNTSITTDMVAALVGGGGAAFSLWKASVIL